MQQKILLFILTSLISLAIFNSIALTDPQPKINLRSNRSVLAQFETWKAQYQIRYNSQEEEVFRFSIFQENLEKINKINSEQSNFTLKINHFAHMTSQEFTSTYLNSQKQRSKHSKKLNLQQSYDPSIFPESFSWRERGIITPIQNQGLCDASYAFSTLGMMEAHYYLHNRQALTQFSTQQLISCNSFGYGCNGGDVEQCILFYAGQNPVAIQNYPYTSTFGDVAKCNEDAPEVPRFRFYNVDIYHPINGKGIFYLKKAIYSTPVSSSIDGSKIQFYHSGILDQCGDDESNDNNIDMLVTGYTKNHWELKSSFGTQWGEQGYLKLAMGETCGITTKFYTVGVPPDDDD